MGRKTNLDSNDKVRALHAAATDLGLHHKQEIPRQDMDDMIRAAFAVKDRGVISNYVSQGRALRLWRVVEGHGRQRGHIVWLAESRLAT